MTRREHARSAIYKEWVGGPKSEGRYKRWVVRCRCEWEWTGAATREEAARAYLWHLGHVASIYCRECGGPCRWEACVPYSD